MIIYSKRMPVKISRSPRTVSALGVGVGVLRERKMQTQQPAEPRAEPAATCAQRAPRCTAVCAQAHRALPPTANTQPPFASPLRAGLDGALGVRRVTAGRSRLSHAPAWPWRAWMEGPGLGHRLPGPGISWDTDGRKEAVCLSGALAPRSHPHLLAAPRVPPATSTWRTSVVKYPLLKEECREEESARPAHCLHPRTEPGEGQAHRTGPVGAF